MKFYNDHIVLFPMFLTPFSHALVADRPQPELSAPSHPSPYKVGCINPSSPSRGFVPFHAPEDPGFDFGILTKYYPHYPNALKSELQLAKFEIYYPEPNVRCGWTKARKVRAKGLLDVGGHRGDIYWRYSDLKWVDGLTNSSLAAHWTADSPDHIPPRTAKIPSENTFNTVADILQKNAPAADVYQVSTICLGYVTGLLAFALLMLSVHRCTKRASRKAQDDDYNGSLVELAEIKSQRRSNVSHPRLDRHEYGLSSTQQDPRNPFATFSESGGTESLPRYTR